MSGVARRLGRQKAEPQEVRLGAFLRAHLPLSADAVVELGIALADALIDADVPGALGKTTPGSIELTPDSFKIDAFGYIQLDPGGEEDADARAGFRTWSAPEQLAEGAPGLQAWMFTVGAILYEAATGDALFEGAEHAIATAMVRDDLECTLMLAAVDSRLAGVREGLDAVVGACLQVEPEARPDTAALLRLHLEAIQEAANRSVLGPLVSSQLAEAVGALETMREAPALPAPAFGGIPIDSAPAEANELLGANVPGEWFLDGGGEGGLGGVPGSVADIELTPPDPAEPSGPAPWEISETLPEIAEEPEGPTDAAIEDATAESPPEVDLDPDREAPAAAGALGGFRDTENALAIRSARVRPLAEARTTRPHRRSGTGRTLLLAILLGLLVVGGFAQFAVGAGPASVAGQIFYRGVDLLPTAIKEAVSRPVDHRARLVWPGDAQADAYVAKIWPMLEAEADLPDATGRLFFDFVHAANGEPLQGAVRWTAEPLRDPRGEELAWDIHRVEGPGGASTAPNRVAVSGEGLESVQLPAGWWALSVTYVASSLTGPITITIQGVRIAPGHLTTLAADVVAPAGLLEPRVLLDDQDSQADFQIALYAPEPGATVQAMEERTWQVALRQDEEPRPSGLPPKLDEHAPIWMGSLGDLEALPAGQYVARVWLDDGVRWPSVAWYPDLSVGQGMDSTEPVWKLQRAAEINPSGPGIRMHVLNFGDDVSRTSHVFLYRAGEDVTQAAAAWRARGGRYLDVPPGSYSLRAVHHPNGLAGAVVGERVLEDFVVRAEGVTEASVDVEFAMAWLDLGALDADLDISSDVRLRVVREGADPEAGKPVLDEDGVGRHVLPAGTYDVYVTYVPPDERAPIEVAFESVELGPGDRWIQRWQARSVPWMAQPPRPEPHWFEE